ncbi:nucleotide-binding domain-containing protein [Backusella circina FSU 941]|nr:nucleotide-binding domain-containing protein [Backusella circina FSU 941]
MSKNIVVVGAGVSGLTTAVSLLKDGHKNVRVVSKHVPGDLSSEYTSPWAGASILTVAEPDDHRLQEIDMYTMNEFGRLAKEVPESYVMVCDGVQYNEEPALPGQDPLWLKKIYKDVKEIPKEKLIKGAVFGYTFQTYTANVPKYLAWLVKTLEQLGGTLERVEFKSLNEVIETYKDADVVVNCTGLGSYYLEDVKDHTMYPIRGQTITVYAPHIKKQHYIDAENRWTYIIPREDGSVICGGTVDRENRQTSPDPAITKDILERCYNLCPEITHGKGPEAFEIVRYNVGFRPGRKDGIRLEKEHRRRSNGQKVIVVHNYGHSSHGYQSSWGSSKKAVELVNDEHLSKL